MPLVVAAIAPHGDVFGDPPVARETREAMDELERRFTAARPDVVVVLTPHNVKVEGHFAVVAAGRVAGDASEWNLAEDTHIDVPGDPEFAELLIRCLRDEDLPAVAVSYGANDRAQAGHPLDWGSAIPLVFMGGRSDPAVPAVVVCTARDLGGDAHVNAGRALAHACARTEKRVALIASADHGHGHDPDGPYGYAPESAVFDERVVELVRENRLDDLLEIELDLVERARADSFWQLLMLHGALGDDWLGELLSYEAPTYFGMLCASYMRK